MSAFLSTSRLSSALYKLCSIQLLQSFSFYGIRSILLIYFTQQMVLSELQALTLYGNTMALLYVTPIIDGGLIDKYLASSLNLIMGTLLVSISAILMPLPNTNLFYGGLGMLIIGQGLSKPTVAYMIDQLYPQQDSSRVTAYTRYYMMVNLGAVFAPFALGIIKQAYGWEMCFVAGLVTSTIGFSFSLKLRRVIEKTSPKTAINVIILFAVCILGGTIIFHFLQAPHHVDQFVIYTIPLVGAYLSYLFFTAPNRLDFLLLVLVIALFGLFVILFEQSGGAIILFLEKHVDRSIGELQAIPAPIFLSLNHFFIIIVSYVVSRFQFSLPSLRPLSQLSTGFLFIALGFGLLWIGAARPIKELTISMGWVIAAFFCHAMGELLIVPLTLSLAAVLAPKNKKGGMIGLWCLTAAYGHYLAAVLARTNLSNIEFIENFQQIFSFTAAVALGCAIILSILAFKKTFLQKNDC